LVKAVVLATAGWAGIKSSLASREKSGRARDWLAGLRGRRKEKNESGLTAGPTLVGKKENDPKPVWFIIKPFYFTNQFSILQTILNSNQILKFE
jgi:hypothetical protein